MKDKPTGKTYRIREVADLAKIPPEARERFAAQLPDLFAVLDVITGVMEGARVGFLEATGGRGVVWRDDGLQTTTIRIVGPREGGRE